MESVTVPVIARVIVSLLNKYVLDFKWCTVVKDWYEGDEDWCRFDVFIVCLFVCLFVC